MPRKNPAIPRTQEPVTIKFDGAEYQVAFTFNTPYEIERFSGRSFLDDLRDCHACYRGEEVQPRLAFLRAALYVLLRDAGCRLTLEQVGERLSDFNELGPVYTGILLAWAKSQDKGKKQDPPPATIAS